MIYKGLSNDFTKWLAKYSQPLVREFDHSVVKQIFQNARNAIIIFDNLNSGKMARIAEKVAEKYGGNTIITELRVITEFYIA